MYNNLLIDTSVQSTAAVQSPQDSSSAQIPSPPSSPKLEEAVADPTQNPLVHTCTLLLGYCDDNFPCLQTSTQTLPSDYKPDNVVVGFDSSYEVIPSELSTILLTQNRHCWYMIVLYTPWLLYIPLNCCLCFL